MKMTRNVAVIEPAHGSERRFGDAVDGRNSMAGGGTIRGDADAPAIARAAGAGHHLHQFMPRLLAMSADAAGAPSAQRHVAG